jgi:hypothetical protein
VTAGALVNGVTCREFREICLLRERIFRASVAMLGLSQLAAVLMHRIQYEKTDAAPWLLASLGVGIAGFVALVPLMLLLAYPSVLVLPVVVPPAGDFAGPRLQTDPGRDLLELRRVEVQQLSSYGWAERDPERLHIPIDRAMDLTLLRGLPGWRKP